LSLSSPALGPVFSIDGNLTLAGTMRIVQESPFQVGSWLLFAYTGSLTNAGISIIGLDGNYSLTFNEGSHSVYLNAVPEPSTYALLALGGAALFLIMRRRKPTHLTRTPRRSVPTPVGRFRRKRRLHPFRIASLRFGCAPCTKLPTFSLCSMRYRAGFPDFEFPNLVFHPNKPRKHTILKSLVPALGIALLSSATLHAQTDGDYQSNAASGVFGDANNWQVFNFGSWQTAATPPDSTSGAITISGNNALAVATSVTIDQTTVASMGQLTINPTKTLTIANGAGMDLTIDGTLLNSGTLAMNSGATWLVGAIGTYIHNTGGNTSFLNSATFVPGSTVIYRGSSTLNASTAVSGRTYSNLTFESSSGAWQPNSLSGSGTWTVNGDLIVGGATGTVNLGYGAFTGATNFNDDVVIHSGSRLGSATNGARSFTIAATKSLNLDASAGVNIASGQTVTIAGGGLAFVAGGGFVAGSGNFTLDSGATININDSQGLDGAISVSGAKSFSTGANYVFQTAGGMGASMPVATNGLVLAATSGTITLDGAGSSLTVNGQYNQAGGTLAAGATRDQLVLARTVSDGNPAAILGSGAIIESGVNVQFNGANATTIQTNAGSAQTTVAGAVDLGGNTRIFDVGEGSAETDLLISGQISNGGLTKNGDGRLLLTGANDYSGGTTVNAGTLAVSGAGTLGSTAGFVTVNGGILNLGGSTFTASAFSLNGGSVQNGSISSTSGTDFSQGGSSNTNIEGSGGVTVGGGATVTLSGNNTYSGETQVDGTLIAGSSTALSANSAYTVNSGATLNLNGNDSAIGGLNGSGSVVTGSADLGVGSGSFSGNISSSGQLDKTSSGTLILSGSSNTLGSALVSEGTLEVAASGATGGAPVRVVNNGHFKVNGGVNAGGNVTLGSDTATYEKQLNAGEDLANTNPIISDLGGNNTTVEIGGGTVGDNANLTAQVSAGDSSILSDKITLNGLDGTTFLLVMYTAPELLTAGSYLGWFDPSDSTWKLATDGNYGTAGSLAGSHEMTYQTFLADNDGWNATTMLGAYGVDTANGSVWAVIDHNSEFGAVPEPSTWALLTLGGSSIALLARRKKQMT
ncbi:MAG: autotransporter-associated beta strand repeat-containing protein, partial [Terrimicrobiaceae bacterium]